MITRSYRLLAVLALLASPAAAQVQPASAPAEAVTLTLEEALEIALISNYAVQSAELDVVAAKAQVREAWGLVLPNVDVSSSYTRNVKSANPFAGSAAGSFFSSFGFIDWLSFNEQARTDDDPATVPIPFGQFIERQQAGLEEAGIVPNTDDNPFSVPNQFQNNLSITQTIFSGSAIASISGAEKLRRLNERGVARQQQLVVDQVRQAFYQALLAEEQARIVALSVARTRDTRQEVAKRVTQGVAPKYQRLSADVQLTNLETQLVQVQNQTTLAVDNLKFILGIPVEQPLRLRGTLEADEFDYLTVSAQDAYALAVERRPDLEQADLGVELRKIDRNIVRTEYLPRVEAFANFSYTGTVPDNRTITLSDPNDPFKFSTVENGFFSSAYWQPAINVGFRLQWNLFNGFQTSARAQQRQVEVEKARIERTQLQQAVRLEVETALRNLETARQRILAQQQNVERAELNYEYASARLREGVASPLEERDASEQLDQSRLNYLQAVYDYLLARSAFEAAVGLPPTPDADPRLTSVEGWKVKG